MTQIRIALGFAIILGVLAGCGDRNTADQSENIDERFRDDGEGLFDLFGSPNENTTIRVNKYLWAASLEVLNFLPLQSADPFTGILVFDYGRAPGSSRAVRATVLVQDPALDARSLKVALQTRGGPASVEMTRAVENAILTRARQLRIRDSGL